jgi:hypothetical protein
VAVQVPGASLISIEPFLAISSDLLLPLELVKTTVRGNRRVAVFDRPPLVSKRPDTVPGGDDWIWIVHPAASARRQTDETAKSFWCIPIPNVIAEYDSLRLGNGSVIQLGVLRPRTLVQIERCAGRRR